VRDLPDPRADKSMAEGNEKRCLPADHRFI
jgi:hypothetical protein